MQTLRMRLYHHSFVFCFVQKLQKQKTEKIICFVEKMLKKSFAVFKKKWRLMSCIFIFYAYACVSSFIHLFLYCKIWSQWNMEQRGTSQQDDLNKTTTCLLELRKRSTWTTSFQQICKIVSGFEMVRLNGSWQQKIEFNFKSLIWMLKFEWPQKHWKLNDSRNIEYSNLYVENWMTSRTKS